MHGMELGWRRTYLILTIRVWMAYLGWKWYILRDGSKLMEMYNDDNCTREKWNESESTHQLYHNRIPIDIAYYRKVLL